MRRSWLIQRLISPRYEGEPPAGPFTFGAGGSGLSDEALSLLDGVWSFDYMGAAEYEFGAVARSLQDVAKKARREMLRASRFEVDLNEVQPDWDLRKSSYKKDWPKAVGSAPVFLLCEPRQEAEIERRIRVWAGGQQRGMGDDSTRDRVGIDSSLRPNPAKPWHGETGGWLEMSNHLLFFTDETMWRKTCAIFETEAP